MGFGSAVLRGLLLYVKVRKPLDSIAMEKELGIDRTKEEDKTQIDKKF